MRALHQFVPTFAARDAIGNHALQVQKLLRGRGLESEVFTSDAGPGVERYAKDASESKPDSSGETGILLHFSVGSDLTEELIRRPEPLVMQYHNITPGKYFDAWHPEPARNVRWGLAQLRRLRPRAVLSLAVSEFNAAELAAAGYKDVRITPVLVDLKNFSETSDRRTTARLRGLGGSKWLFVGRIVPNKAQHDLISAFAVYRRLYDPLATLNIVGGVSAPRYEQTLHKMITFLGLGDSITLTGSVSAEVMASYFEASDVFVCLSDHEGFCVPLLEAMRADLPIVAYRAGAVPETVGDAGLLLNEKSPATVAASVARVSSDDALRAELISRGAAQLEVFSLERCSRLLMAALDPLVAS